MVRLGRILVGLRGIPTDNWRPAGQEVLDPHALGLREIQELLKILGEDRVVILTSLKPQMNSINDCLMDRAWGIFAGTTPAGNWAIAW